MVGLEAIFFRAILSRQGINTIWRQNLQRQNRFVYKRFCNFFIFVAASTEALPGFIYQGVNKEYIRKLPDILNLS